MDICCLKLNLKKHVLSAYLDSLRMDPHIKDIFRQTLASHESYRTNNGFPDDMDTDISWRAGWPRGVEAIYSVLEAPFVCFPAD